MREKHINERRLAQRLIDYWVRLKGDRSGLPSIKKFDPSTMEDIWANCLRLMVRESNGKRFYLYEHMGKEIVRAYGKDLTNENVSPSIRNLPGARVVDNLDSKIPISEPVLAQGNFINNDDEVIKYRSCILPFGGVGGEISHAVIGLSWQVFR